VLFRSEGKGKDPGHVVPAAGPCEPGVELADVLEVGLGDQSVPLTERQEVVVGVEVLGVQLGPVVLEVHHDPVEVDGDDHWNTSSVLPP
jgi:hypothetical protein